MPNQGEIVLINIPFSNLKATKKRPVLIISKNEYNNKQDDIIIAAITSNITSKDYTVEFENSDMKKGFLPKKSCVRADKLYSLDKSLIIKNFGIVSDDIISKVINMIFKVLANPGNKQ